MFLRVFFDFCCFLFAFFWFESRIFKKTKRNKKNIDPGPADHAPIISNLSYTSYHKYKLLRIKILLKSAVQEARCLLIKHHDETLIFIFPDYKQSLLHFLANLSY